MKRNACQKCAFAVRDDNPHCGLRGFTTSFNVEWCEAENDKAPNGYELQEDGYFSWVKKKKEYPKTIAECKDETVAGSGYKTASLLTQLERLLVCRDAYWKLAGDWKPDWEDVYSTKWTIITSGTRVRKADAIEQNYILAFPTEEMRDAFYENFKELIEQCKELL